jgi:hypothetical protein
MTGASLRERAKEELRVYAVVSLYLYVCFGALVLYQDALIQTDGGELLRHGVAAIKALVIGKFLLIGRAVGAGTRLPASTLAGRVVLRSLLLLIVVVVLSIAEELIMGAVHGRKVSETLAELVHRPGLMLFAKCVLVMLIILPLVTLETLERVLGRDALRRLLFAAKNPAQPS